ncbi:hypothetical protein WN51_09994 [Melipona quadrifasciata]|uniref:Uncharacterized protein n=1 Tax=Melipona quadrifasciata TaxID=166423 RepID=A0A0M9ADR9_9HYME|nr:hypothetical protein WN51_09994 [Melipona quadrifasciata]
MVIQQESAQVTPEAISSADSDTQETAFESVENEEEKRDEAEEEYKPPRHRKITHAPNFISKLRSASRKQEGKGKTYLCYNNVTADKDPRALRKPC